MSNPRDIALKQPAGFTQGIYFGLPNEEYHADCALSHSGLAHLLEHPYDYWVKGPLNPTRSARGTTDAMKFGTQCHMALFEPERFKTLYRGALEAYDRDKITLSTTSYNDVMESVKMLEPIRPLYFTKGMPEVSIFWIDPMTGLRMRIRVDYLRTFGGLDYKRCKDIKLSKLGYHMAEHCYDLQDVLYSQGIAEVKKSLLAGTATVWGDHDAEWLKAFASDPDSDFMFVFQRSQWPFVYRFPYFDIDIKKDALFLIEDAKQIYLDYIDKYGTDEWPAGAAEPEEFPKQFFPRRSIERGVRL